MRLNINDFIILDEPFEDLDLNSVGVVEEVYEDNTYLVFFIGRRLEVVIPEEKIHFLDMTQTGKPYKYKVCNVCHILKEDFVEFDINQTDAKGQKTTRPSCKTCRIEIDGVKLSTKERKRMLEVKPFKFFVCPICEKGSIPDMTAKVVIDHCHENGHAREWICDSCNTGLGRFKDDIDLLNKAIEYLRKHKHLEE